MASTGSGHEFVYPEKVSTGVSGLDQVLKGGLPKGEVFLLQGGPGTGKTTLAFQFLRASAEDGQRVLYLTLSQTKGSLEAIARSHGWATSNIVVRELADLRKVEDADQSVFPSSEIELEETLAVIREVVEETQATAAIIDSVSDLRVLSADQTKYRRELLRLRRFLHSRACTTLFLDVGPEDDNVELRNQTHGIIELSRNTPEYGEERRRLQITKMRGTPFASGYHNFRIRTGGIEVFPRLQSEVRARFEGGDRLSSSVPELDTMLGGGLREGTACLITGPPGAGKTTIGFIYAHAAAQRGQRAATFLFNERKETFYQRAHGIGLDIDDHIEAGRLMLHQIDTGTISASEFAQKVRAAVEDEGARVVIIDSLNGYINAMLNRELLISQMHELLSFLSHAGVLTILIADQHRTVSADHPASPTHVSYLADSVMLVRYREADGQRQRTISILKQRYGKHDQQARVLRLTSNGIEIADPVPDGGSLMLEPPLFATFQRQSLGSGSRERPLA